MSFSIRPAKDSDQDIVMFLKNKLSGSVPFEGFLYLGCYSWTPQGAKKVEGTVVTTPELMKQNLFVTPFAHALLAISPDGLAVGIALYYFNFSSSTGRPGLYLKDLFVKPEFRKHGLGRALFADLAKVAQEKKCGQIDWPVLKWNTPTIGFYENALKAKPNDENMRMSVEEDGFEYLRGFGINQR